MEPRRFYIDTQLRRFVSEIGSDLPIYPPTFYTEDVESIELYFLEPELSTSDRKVVVDYSAATVKFAVGTTTPAALGVTWNAISPTVTASITTITNGTSANNEIQRLTFSGQEPRSGSIRFTIPQRTVTATSVDTGRYFCANHGIAPGQYVTLSGFVASAGGITIGTTFYTNRVQNGTSQVLFAEPDFIVIRHPYLANSVVNPDFAAANSSTGGTITVAPITTPAVSFDRLTERGIEEAFLNTGRQTITAPDGGVFPVGLSTSVLASGTYDTGFDLEFAGYLSKANIGTLSAQSTLKAYPGLQGNVSFNTAQAAAIAGQEGIKMEVEVSQGSARHTTQSECLLLSDVIDSTSASPLPANTASSFNLSDNNGGVWTVTIDSSGSLTAAKV